VTEVSSDGVSRYRYTYQEYVAYERVAAMKHEFVDGEILGIAGVSPRHSALVMRVTAAIERDRQPGCHGFSSNQRIRVLATGRVAYADASMVCGPIESDPVDRDTITNPTLLVEVLSPSTEEVDRSSKWRDYQLLPSLQEYVLVSQAQPRVEVYRRLASGSWEYVDVGEGAVKLTSGATLDLSILYRDLPD
jgi:Uma2 family endonuclease